MLNDYNHDGKIDSYDREMEEIFLEDDERIWMESENRVENVDGWVFIVVVGIIIVMGLWLGFL